MSRIRSVSKYRRPALTLALSGVMAAGCSGAPDELSPGSLKQGISTLKDLLVPTGQAMVVNTYAEVMTDAKVGDLTLTINAAELGAATPADGDLVMVYQAQGAQISTTDDATYGGVSSLGGAGSYEVFRIDGFDAGQGQFKITAGCGLRNPYLAAGKTQAILVPRYHNVTLQPSVNGVPRGTIVPQPWNGKVGGVVALRAQSIQDDGSIDVTGAGFRGGLVNTAAIAQLTAYTSTNPTAGGEKGESVAGYQTDYDAVGGRYGKGAPANGGGGGSQVQSSGGGGANGGKTPAYTGDGVMGNTAMYAVPWMLDPYYVANQAFATSSGGGRGGYTFSNANLNPTVVAPGDATWLGDSRQNNGGRGGHPLLGDATSRLFFGGGGGGGDNENNKGGAGGAGGGIALILADTITAAAGGCVLAEGADGVASRGDGAGGGGGGGSIVLGSPAVRGVNVAASGGAGGFVSTPGLGTQGYGPGGGGGGGYIAVPVGTAQSPLANGGTAGTTNAAVFSAFPMNGATNGGVGTVGAPSGPLPVCLPAELSVTYTATPTTVRINTPIHYTATVSNAGPEDATNVQLTLTVPPGTTVDTTPSGGAWKCVLAATTYTCTLPNLASNTTAPVIDFIYDARMDSAETITSTATLTADNTDVNMQNNMGTVTVNIDRTTVNGGGFSCSASGKGAAQGGAGAGLGLLFGAFAMLMRTRRRQQVAK